MSKCHASRICKSPECQHSIRCHVIWHVFPYSIISSCRMATRLKNVMSVKYAKQSKKECHLYTKQKSWKKKKRNDIASRKNGISLKMETHRKEDSVYKMKWKVLWMTSQTIECQTFRRATHLKEDMVFKTKVVFIEWQHTKKSVKSLK